MKASNAAMGVAVPQCSKTSPEPSPPFETPVPPAFPRYE
jgi:hypothetical protein